MTIKKIITLLLITLTFSCSTEENPKENITNSPPESFSLLKVENKKSNVTLNPTLTWSEAVDPDDDTVSYSVLIDENSEPSTVISQNLNSNNFTLQEPLQKCTTYYWQIIAKDSNGSTTKSEIFQFDTYAVDFENVAISGVAEFSRRKGHSTSVFYDQLWIIGGDIGALNKTNTVWSSNDGTNWEQLNENIPFEARSEHSALIFKDQMWIIAGRTSGNSGIIDRNDVWKTENGADWAEVTNSADFSKRFGQGAVVFKNKMWIVGGFDGEYKNDVWSSEDGNTWTQVTSMAAFSGRVSHSLLVLNNKLWVIGGRDSAGNRKNDVWSSEDGMTWNEVTTNAPFKARSLHASVVFCNKLWIIGGASGSDWRNDVWFSEDGENWSLVEEEIPFIGRHSHTATTFKDYLWIIGGLGNDFNLKNDVIAVQ